MKGISALRPAEPPSDDEPGSRQAPSEDLDVIRYVRVLIRRRRTILVAGLCAMVVAAPFDLMRPAMYEAEAVLVAVAPKLGSSAQPDMPTLRSLLQNRALATQMIEKFKLDEPPMSITLQDFFDDHFNVGVVQGAYLLIAQFRAPDRDLAANVLNTLADAAVDLNRRINADEIIWVRDQIKSQRDEMAIRLRDAEQQLITYRVGAQIDVARRDADALLEKRGELVGLIVAIEAERAELGRLQEELAKRPQMLETQRTFDDDATMMEAARNGESSKAPMLGLRLNTQIPNPVYQEVDKQAASSSARLANLERQYSSLTRQLGVGKEDKAGMSTLYRKDVEVARLVMEYDLARKVFEDVAFRYEQSRVQAASNSPQLQVVDRAVPPEDALPRRLGLITLLAFMIGIAGAVFWMVTREMAHAVMGHPPTA